MADNQVEKVPPNPPPVAQTPGGEKFYNIWLKALFVPTESTYDAILAEPDMNVMRGVTWLGIMSFVSFALLFCVIAALYAALLTLLMPSMQLPNSSAGDTLLASGTFLLTMGCFGLIYSLVNAGLNVALSLGNARVGSFLAQRFGGVGTFQQHYFAIAAYGAPLQILNVIGYSIPYLSYCLGPIVALYGIFLNVRVIKSVHKLDWGKSIIASPSVWLAGMELICFGIGVVLYFVVIVAAFSQQ